MKGLDNAIVRWLLLVCSNCFSEVYCTLFFRSLSIFVYGSCPIQEKSQNILAIKFVNVHIQLLFQCEIKKVTQSELAKEQRM